LNRRRVRFVLIAAGALATYGVAAFWFLLPPIERPPSVAISTVSPEQCADPVFAEALGTQHTILFAPLDRIPGSLVDALLAQEDGFYNHHGVNWSQLARAAARDLKAGRIKYGGSTLTMQLVRELFLEKKRTFLRKAREIAYALQAERRLTKADILELYLNVVHWGPGIRGVGSAACYYFGVLPPALTGEQAKHLVEVLPNPDVRGEQLRAARAKQ